jgi:hypothetical protein
MAATTIIRDYSLYNLKLCCCKNCFIKQLNQEEFFLQWGCFSLYSAYSLMMVMAATET